MKPPPRRRSFRTELGPRPNRPPLALPSTTLWEYPSQHYGDGRQGDALYVGATPSWVIWNVIELVTEPGALVVDPFVGSGTTLDVARDTGRKARGFDVSPYRPDVERADARKLPVADGAADLVFMDPPYGDHIHYSDAPECIGRLSAYDDRYYQAMDAVFAEALRVLRPGGTLALYVADSFDVSRGFAPAGLSLAARIAERFELRDHVAVVRRHKRLEEGNVRRAAEEGRFMLRGFNHLFLAEKPRVARAGRPGPEAAPPPRDERPTGGGPPGRRSDRTGGGGRGGRR